MSDFVNRHSIVRKIWGSSDTILFIFAGAAAEFALSKAVDWLYFTGKLPADPLKRLFSTVAYAHQIVFSSEEKALQAIDSITLIHRHVEHARGQVIPEWAYRDVLYMLIDYSIRAYEVLQRQLTLLEKEEVFTVFYRMGQRMEIPDLPSTYVQWLMMRTTALNENLSNSHFTKDLYQQYRKHLGGFRFWLLKRVQSLLAPKAVKSQLNLEYKLQAGMLLSIYKATAFTGMQQFIKGLLLPPAYKQQIVALDR